MTLDAAPLAVIVNPVGAADEAEELRQLLSKCNVSADWIETTADDPGKGQTERAISSGAGVIIACGGDGTVRACLEAAAGSSAAVGIIPAGTGNLLARNLGIPLEAERALDVVMSESPVPIDLGYANGEAFAVMAGLGVDARIMQDTERDAKEAFGALAYVATTMRHLRDHRFTATLALSGTLAWTGAASSVVVANHGDLQGGLTLFPDASAHDGQLDVLVASARSPWEWALAAWAVLRKETATGRVERFRDAALIATMSDPVPYQIDGEDRDPTTQVKFWVVPDAVAVIAPREDSV